MRWWLSDRLEEYREWREHRKTRSMAARLQLAARAYARRTETSVVILTEELGGIKVHKHRCDMETLIVKAHVVWSIFSAEHTRQQRAKAEERTAAGLLN